MTRARPDDERAYWPADVQPPPPAPDPEPDDTRHIRRTPRAHYSERE